MEDREKSKKRVRMLWAPAVAVTVFTILALVRQPELNAFRPVHLALVFANGLIVGVALARMRMYFRGEGNRQA